MREDRDKDSRTLPPTASTLEMWKETIPPTQPQHSPTYGFASMWLCVRRALILSGYSTLNMPSSLCKRTQWDVTKLEEDINVLELVSSRTVADIYCSLNSADALRIYLWSAVIDTIWV